MFWRAASAGAGTHLRLNAQLIDTRTDTHVWAEQYDRDLNDLFAIQSEIAQKVAERLNAKITSAEKLAIEDKPTGDLVAFDLYSRANDIFRGTTLARAAGFAAGNRSAEPGCGARPIVSRGVLPTRFRLMISFTSMGSTILPRGWRWRKQPSSTHFASVRMRAKRTSHEHFIFINGYLDYDGALAELEVARQSCQMIPGYSS